MIFGLPEWLWGPDTVLLVVDLIAYVYLWKDIHENVAETSYDRYWFWVGAPVNMFVELWLGLYLTFASWLLWWVLRLYQKRRRASNPKPEPF